MISSENSTKLLHGIETSLFEKNQKSELLVFEADGFSLSDFAFRNRRAPPPLPGGMFCQFGAGPLSLGKMRLRYFFLGLWVTFPPKRG